MTLTKAANMALQILDAFKEAENLYGDYQEDMGFTDDEYDQMLSCLEEIGEE